MPLCDPDLKNAFVRYHILFAAFTYMIQETDWLGKVIGGQQLYLILVA